MGTGRLTVSFDLDGTLTKSSFVDSVWMEGLPGLVADKLGTGFETAREMCVQAYARVGDDSLLWYRLPYWLEYFGLDGVDAEGFIAGFGHRLELFDDVLPVLEGLKGQGHDLVLFSNAARPFLNVEVSRGALEPFFSVMVSVSDDWGMVKSDPDAFRRLKHMTGPDLIHVGDHARFDYEVPRGVGITSYLVSRDPRTRSDGALASLYEILDLAQADSA
jgi:FMN phosphatase YigB (HAD superfamily)